MLDSPGGRLQLHPLGRGAGPVVGASGLACEVLWGCLLCLRPRGWVAKLGRLPKVSLLDD